MRRSMKSIGYASLRIAALTIVLFILFAVGGTLISAPMDPAGPDETTAALLLLAACFLDVLVLSFIIRRSAITGWRLVAHVFLVFYGVMTFMSQIEAAVFPTQMSSEMVWRVLAMGLVITAPFSVIAVPLLGRWREPAPDANKFSIDFGALGLIWRLAVIAIAYVVIYFLFGYFVAWQFREVRNYYGGSEPQGFFNHFLGIVVKSPWLILFQMVRGLIWAFFGYLIVRIVGVRKYQTPLAVGLAFAVLMNSQLLLPNPFMPEAVRMAHLLETASSNFLFGIFVGWLLLFRINNDDGSVSL